MYEWAMLITTGAEYVKNLATTCTTEKGQESDE